MEPFMLRSIFRSPNSKQILKDGQFYMLLSPQDDFCAFWAISLAQTPVDLLRLRDLLLQLSSTLASLAV
jgi:hypothetical protein